MAKKNKSQLTYFLDHPQIKRHPSPGNGNSPGFFNQLASGKLSNPSGSKTQTQQPKSTNQPSSARPSSSGSSATNPSGQSSWQKAFSKGFKGD